MTQDINDIPEIQVTEVSVVPEIYSSPSMTSIEHATDLSARNAIVNGTLDMQEALFEHASRYRSRLKGLSGVISNLHGKIFNDEFIDELDPRSLIKLYMLARESENSAIEYLERLHKVVQDSQKVIKVTQTLSMSGVTPHQSSETEDVDKMKLDEIRSLLMQAITSSK